MIEEPRDAVLEEFGYSTWDVQRVDVSVFLKEPHPGQLRVKRSQAKFKVVKAGRRGGKTTGAAGLAVEGFLEGRRVLYGVPVSDQLERFWTECQIALADALRKKVYLLNQTMHLICKSELDHARIRAKTAWNADTLRGDEADLLILDEWQLMDEEAWTRVGAPMLIDKNGDAIFIYTPPSLASKSVSKARDKKHASKLFKDAQQHFENRVKAGKIPDWETFHWRSMDNPHLSREGLAQVSENLTSLAYRQEIMAEDVDEAPGALWKRSWLEANRVRSHPDLIRVVTAIDPPGGATECGIVTAGIGYCFCKGGKEPEIHGFVLEDASTKVGEGPEIWAPEALRSQRDHEGDKIVAEVNYGGDMVEHTIKVYDPRANVQMVHATRGKAVRAEPVSALDEKGKIHHVGAFPDMEDELCEWIPGQTGHSPNRLDACLVKGTLIRTNTGDVPIEKVKVGDLVLTRKGFRRVSRAEKTQDDAEVSIIEFSDGTTLTGTDSHPVWANDGFIPLGLLREGDRVCTQWSYSKESSTLGKKERITSSPPEVRGKACSTERSGRLRSGLFQKGITFIISMVTHLTMIWKTLLWSHLKSMVESMLQSLGRLVANGLIRSDLLLSNGMLLERDISGMRSIQEKHGKKERRQFGLHAVYVGSLFSDTKLLQEGTHSAENDAGMLLPRGGSSLKRLFVQYVQRRLSGINTDTPQRHAPVYVVRSYVGCKAPVWNLEVEDQHEYFANGVLVHNCVWALTDLMVQSDYSPLSQGMMVGTPRNQEFLPPQVWPSQF